MASHATLVGMSFEIVLCEHCHETHEVQVEIWSWSGVHMTRYLTKCQPKPVYGFAY